MINLFGVVILLLVAAGGIALIRRDLLRQHIDDTWRKVLYASGVDATMGRDFAWRILTYIEPTTRQMLWQFWRPFKSFYPSMDFTEPGATEPEQADA